jgi:hypothetical protein
MSFSIGKESFQQPSHPIDENQLNGSDALRDQFFLFYLLLHKTKKRIIRKNDPPLISFENYLGRKTGLEPATFGTTNQRSNQLSYILRL